ncbi:MAG: universal stress protein, partial [Burkholderiales bacterium]
MGGLPMYERILVPLDGAKYSEEMLPHAAGLARVHGTTLTLMRVAEKESGRREAETYASSLAGRFAAQSLCVIGHGDVADAVVEEARRVPGTLVAMTSHGRSGLMEVMLGSVALRVVRSAGMPVLVYRPSAADGKASAPGKVARIVLPLDGTPIAEAMAPPAAELAKWLDAELLVISVLDPSTRVDAGIPPSDVVESSFVHAKARELGAKYGVRVSWEV